jgi:hypothetical protein
MGAPGSSAPENKQLVARWVVLLGAGFILLAAVVPTLLTRAWPMLMAPFLALVPGGIDDVPLCVGTSVVTVLALTALAIWAWRSDRVRPALWFMGVSFFLVAASLLRILAEAVDVVS